MGSSRCAIGLLTWNGGRDVARCVESILAQTESSLELRWIDNASTDRTVTTVQDLFPDFPPPEIMRANIGFCAGHNRLFAATRAPYYLALNQDAFLAPDYVRRLCDWLDEDHSLAMVSGLILRDDSGVSRIYSAGVAMGRGRFPFELRRDTVWSGGDAGRRYVPGVTGAAMLLRREAMGVVADRPGELFPPEFFAYFEEIDLALRIARAGMRCGVDDSALARHAERGRGGRGNSAVRRHYFKNHWLISLRNDRAADLLRDLPFIFKGELLHYLPQYVREPVAALQALGSLWGCIGPARGSFHRMNRMLPQSLRGRNDFYRLSRRLLRDDPKAS